ncbi:ribosomal subunit 39S-domain-containing protein [Aspergillus ambiguus]|uniref:mitochondrial 54S ribosomal mL50 protein n=1 Tax=Aspergillus ambiguus TaxID=176160 RepID=UPI003CCE3A98
MRPSMRLLSLEVSSLQGPRTLYVCSVCRQEARPRPLLARQFLRNASSNTTPITERVRRKIWGTENPPGLKDPYGESLLEKRFRKDQPEQQQAVAEEPAEAVQAVEENVAPEEVAAAEAYEPATTWEGLPRVGHLGEWSKRPRSEADTYESFMLKKKLTKKGHLALAAHQTAVELCLMHSLNKPLTSICDVKEHDKAVFKLLWKCKIQPNGQWGEALTYPDQETKDALVYIFEQIGAQQEPEAAVAEEQVASEESVEASEFEESVEDIQWGASTPPFFGYADVRDKGYLSLPLDDLTTKFAFLKRFSQLSGHYFPDPAIHSISTVAEAVGYIQTVLSPKPKKLAEHLAGNQRLQNMSNVKVFPKKQKRMDQDEELGRKKVIEEELRARGLIE